MISIFLGSPFKPPFLGVVVDCICENNSGKNKDRITFNHEEAGDYTLSEETASRAIQNL
jgi:hypothetical protein